MKKTTLIAALLLLSVMTFAYIGTVAAEVAYDFYPILAVNSKGTSWQFATGDSFSGKDVDESSIVATCFISATDPDGNAIIVTITIEPKQIITTDKTVKVMFNEGNLPPSAETTTLTGELLSTSETFLATGPGFAWGRTR